MQSFGRRVPANPPPAFGGKRALTGSRGHRLRLRRQLPPITWVALGLLASPLAAQHIEMRVSVKVIVDPTNSAAPPRITPEVFYQAASNANLWMDSYSRGYRYAINEVTNIGGPTQGGTNGPSRWFLQDTIRNTDTNLVAAFKSIVKTDPLYLLRPHQINVYVSTGYAGPGNSGGGHADTARRSELGSANLRRRWPVVDGPRARPFFWSVPHPQR
jgi:hypothetical protein